MHICSYAGPVAGGCISALHCRRAAENVFSHTSAHTPVAVVVVGTVEIIWAQHVGCCTNFMRVYMQTTHMRAHAHTHTEPLRCAIETNNQNRTKCLAMEESKHTHTRPQSGATRCVFQPCGAYKCSTFDRWGNYVQQQQQHLVLNIQ